MTSRPTVAKYMTRMPHTIGSDQTLARARQVMLEHRIRHLPVLDGGRLVGIVTDRDLNLVESFKDVDPEKVRVSEAYTPEPYVVSSSSYLDEVCETMAIKKYGCALVVDDNKLVGIFAWVDALAALNHLLRG